MLVREKKFRLENGTLSYAVSTVLLQQRKTELVKFTIKLKYEKKLGWTGILWHLDRKGKMCSWATARKFWFHPCLPIRLFEIESPFFIRSSFGDVSLGIYCILYYVNVSVQFPKHRHSSLNKKLAE